MTAGTVGLNRPPPGKLTRRHPLNLTAQEVGRYAGPLARDRATAAAIATSCR